ncbi:FAD dependent oxidoreductase [Didymella exigua CBS 183.55]|uniref:FAD dependent oxidoreductase n=1 Tax=Didymella exigua CBS 183.55 TaxID=1150837 RepID=A0A6A5RGM1_9PLEO|nr:FAD dependent oxidoreductase [Didymella exigua CBS 183.55]KAF1926659.1 FAD dependent oxidoreductase [Didymella exigua CBS 183.55]
MTRQILPVPNPVPSYWLSEESPLADLRSSTRLPGKCGVAVIGAGLAGVLTAYRILQNSGTESGGEHRDPEAGQKSPSSNADGELTEKLSECATSRNGGHVKEQVTTLLNLPCGAEQTGRKRVELQDYVERAMSDVKRVVEEEDLDCEFELRRSYDVFTDAGDAGSVFQRYEDARKRGEAWTQNVSWVGEERVEQITSIKSAKGAFSVRAASFWPYKFVAGLLERMVKRWPDRLNVQMCTPVTLLTMSSSGANVLVTDRGTLTVKKVVMATNAYTAGLLPAFSGRIIPVRGTASHHAPQKPVNPHLNNMYNINFGPGKGVDYLNPRPDGGIVVGGGAWLFAHNVSSWRDNFDDAHLFPPHEIFLGWKDSGSVNDHVWTGIMGRTGDGQPFVGRVPGKSNMWVLARFNGGGMSLIAVAARTVGKMVSEEKGFEEGKRKGC